MNSRKQHWQAIAARLAQRGSPAPRTGAEQFWRTFEAARHLHPQIDPAPAARAARVPRRQARWILTLGSLGATSLVAAAWLFMFQPMRAEAGFAIHSYEITPSHGTVMLWRDETSNATILWVCNLDETQPESMEDHP